MAKYTFSVNPITITTRSGETFKFEGADFEAELSVPEMMQAAKSASDQIQQLRDFLRSELPDLIRNVSKAVAESELEVAKAQNEKDETRFYLNKKLYGEDMKDCSRVVSSYRHTEFCGTKSTAADITRKVVEEHFGKKKD